MPFIFLTDLGDDDTLRKLTLVYDYVEDFQINGSWVIGDSRTDTLDYVVSHNNMKTVLRTQYYAGFPLAIDSGSWSIGEWVIIESYFALVVAYDDLNGYNCCICEIDTGYTSVVSYDSVTGVLVMLEWIDNNTLMMIELEEMIFDTPQQAVRDEGVYLTAIFIEVAVIMWLLTNRRKIPG